MAERIQFSTDDLPREQRVPYFVAATTDFAITPLVDPLDFSASAITVGIAPLMITQFEFSPSRCCREPDRIAADGRDHFSINFLLEGEAEAIMDGVEVRYAVGDALVVDLSRTMTVTTRVKTRAINVLVPRGYLEDVLPSLTIHRSIAASGAVELARDHALRLLQQSPDDDVGVMALHARALRDTLAAMLTPLHRDDPLERRRNSSLLARAVRYIDAHLNAELDGLAVHTALGVSRSVLYRALRPVGGIESLILRRRLAGVCRLLVDGSDVRTITSIAQDCGFTNMSQFNRQFRRIFGTTPGKFRAGAFTNGERKPNAGEDWQDRYKALVQSIDLAG